MIFWILNKELVNLDGEYTGSAALLIAASTYLRNLITVTKDTQTGKFILTISVKGTVCVILSEPPWKDGNAWSTTIHWNFNLIKRYRRFSNSKCIYFCEFLHCFFFTRNAHITFAKNPQIKFTETNNTNVYFILEQTKLFRVPL